LFYELIRERWPHIWDSIQSTDSHPLQYTVLEEGPVRSIQVNGIQLSSAYNPWREAELQAARVPMNHDTVYLYGFGTGELARLLLQRPQITKLVIVILNPQLFRVVAEFFPSIDILQDPRVYLASATEFGDVRLPFAASTASLALADDQARSLAEKVFVELAAEHNAARHGESDSWIGKQLNENESLIATDGDVQELLQDKVEQAIVVGAGPTLAQRMSWLKAHTDKYMVAVDAALKPLLMHGLKPDVVVSIDPSGDHVSRHLQVEESSAKNIDLVYFPVVRNDVLKAWPGPRYVAYPRHKLYHELDARLPRGKLFASGSVLHPAVDLCVKKGAHKIYLVGADFAFPDEHTHVEGSSFNRSLSSSGELPGVFTRVTSGEGKEVKTQSSFLSYLTELEGYISRWPNVEFINMSRKGARIKGTVYPDEVE
jgi:hypothetical protein